jgi:PhnB protein
MKANEETVMHVLPYLYFEGRCAEAIAFYKKALGAEVTMMMRFDESPEPQPAGVLAPGAEKNVMHAEFRIGDTTLFASDGPRIGPAKFEGISLTLAVQDDAEAKRCFAALSDGGTVRQPLIETFFATSFGMVTDRFGVGWLIIASKGQ